MKKKKIHHNKNNKIYINKYKSKNVVWNYCSSVFLLQRTEHRLKAIELSVTTSKHTVPWAHVNVFVVLVVENIPQSHCIVHEQYTHTATYTHARKMLIQISGRTTRKTHWTDTSNIFFFFVHSFVRQPYVVQGSQKHTNTCEVLNARSSALNLCWANIGRSMYY